MRSLSIILIIIALLAQVLSSWSASAEQHTDGLYYLALTGDQVVIEHICSFGDCGRGFNTRIDALNYWISLQGQAFGLQIVPIPPPP